MKVYFDNAASTPISPAALEAITEVTRKFPGNPSSLHSHGRKLKTIIEQARKSIAGSLNASLGEICFTSGGTESNNAVLKGCYHELNVKRVITTAIEHPCVLNSSEWLRKQGVKVEYINISDKGVIDINHLEELLKNGSEKTLVSVIHANNEIGAINDLKTIAKLCKENGALIHSDTVQSVHHLDIDVQEVPADFLSASAHKFHGPRGSGYLFIRSGTGLLNFIQGGSQERNMRAGTENVAGIAGMHKAAEEMEDNKPEYGKKVQEINDHFRRQLKDTFHNIRINSPIGSLSTILSVSFPPTEKSSMLQFHLDLAGISASAGSACSSGSQKQSHVISALGIPEDYTTIRFSFSHLNTKDEVDYTMDSLKSILSEMVAV